MVNKRFSHVVVVCDAAANEATEYCLMPADQIKSYQIKFINIRQQIIKTTHVKKKQNEQCEDIKGRGRP